MVVDSCDAFLDGSFVPLLSFGLIMAKDSCNWLFVRSIWAISAEVYGVLGT